MSREAANDASTIPTCKAALPRLWNPLITPTSQNDQDAVSRRPVSRTHGRRPARFSLDFSEALSDCVEKSGVTAPGCGARSKAKMKHGLGPLMEQPQTRPCRRAH